MIFKIGEFAGHTLNTVKDFARKTSRIFLSILLVLSLALSVCIACKSVNTFNIFDGKTKKTVRLCTASVAKALRTADLKNEYKILNTSKKGNITDVTIGYIFNVTIKAGDKVITVKTAKATVENILKRAGILLDANDIVKPSKDTVISKDCTIEFSDVEYVTGTYEEVIPCSLATVYSDEHEKGTNTIVRGIDGKQQVFYTAKTVNGKETEKKIDNVVVLSNAVDGKQIIGTAAPKSTAVTTSEQVRAVSTLKPVSAIQLDGNGVPVNYKKCIKTQATGYTYTGHKCATGVTPQPGYIAVNPKVIPYGTKMYIKSSDGKYIYGYAVAADTGGFVRSRPNNVDLFFASHSAAVAFGRRDVEIYIF